MDSYQNYLLEFIAWRLAAGNKEFGEFQTWMREVFKEAEAKTNASSEPSPTEVLRDVRTQPPARAGEVPGHEPGENARVRVNLGDRLAEAKERGKQWLSKK